MKLNHLISNTFHCIWHVVRDGYCRLFFQVMGICLVIGACCRLESRFGQSLSGFVEHNGGELALLVFGLFFFCLGQKWGYGKGKHSGRVHYPAHSRVWSWSRVIVPVLLLAGSVICYGYTLWSVFHSTPGLYPAGAFFLSLMGVVVAVAFWESGVRKRSCFVDLGIFSGASKEKVPFWKRHGFWLVVYLFLWVLLVQINLDSRPGYFHGDEAMVVDYGQQTYIHDKEVLRNAPVWTNSYQPYLSGVPRSLLRSCFPDKLNYGARLFSVLMGALTLGGVFVLGRRYLAPIGAWVALLICSTSHVYLAFSRLALNNIDALFLACGFLLAFLAGWKSRRVSMGMLAGICVGLSYYTYQGALLVVPLVVLVVAVKFLHAPWQIWRRWSILLTFILGFLLAAAPIHLYYRNNNTALNYRTRAVFLFTKDNLELRFKQTEMETVPRLLKATAWPAIGGSLLWPDTSSNYKYRGLPMIDRVMLGVLLLGLVGSFAWWRRRFLVMVLAVWIVLGFVLGAWFAVNPLPPYAPRLLILWPAIALLGGCVAGGLCHLGKQVGGTYTRNVLGALFLVLVTVSGGNSVSHYTWKYLPDLSEPYYHLIPTGLIRWMSEFPDDWHLVMFGDHHDQLYTSVLHLYCTGFPTTSVVGQDKPIPEPMLTVSGTAYVVKIPEYGKMDEKLREHFPDVTPLNIYNPFFAKEPPTHRIYLVEHKEKEKK